MSQELAAVESQLSALILRSTEEVTRKPLSATNLAAFVHNSCELYLNLISRSKTSSSRDRDQPSSTADAFFRKGHEWEAQLCAQLETLELLLEAEGCDDPIGLLLTDARNEFYVHSPSFRPPMFPHLHLPGSMHFTKFIPDFLRVEVTTQPNGIRTYTWQVLDAKASKFSKESHHLQITYYYIALQEKFEEYLATHPEVSVEFQANPYGGIWLPSAPVPQYFPLLHARPIVEDLLRIQLPALLAKQMAEVKWHFNPLCSTCEFQLHCETNTKQHQTVSSIPHLTFSQKDFLVGLINSARHSEAIVSGSAAASSASSSSASSSSLLSPPSLGVTDIEDLHRAIQPNKPLNYHELYKSLPSSAHRLRGLLHASDAGYSPVLEAVRSGTPHVIGQPSLWLSVAEDVAIFLSLLHDPLSDKLCAFAINVYGLAPELCKKLSTWYTNEDPAVCSTFFVTTLGNLVSEFMQMDPSLRVQFYLFSPSEMSLFRNTLVQASLSAQSPADVEAARRCVLTFLHDPSVLQTLFIPDTSGGQFQAAGAVASDINIDLYTRTPKILCLHTLIRDLLALPMPGFSTFESLCEALLNEPCTTSMNGMYSLWAARSLDGLQPHLETYGLMQFRMLDNIRTRVRDYTTGLGLARDHLFLGSISPLHQFDLLTRCNDILLRKLMFMIHHEFILELNGLREERAYKTGRFIELKSLGESSSESDSSQSPVKAQKKLFGFQITQGAEFVEEEGEEAELYRWILALTSGSPTNQLTSDVFFDDTTSYSSFHMQLRMPEPLQQDVSFAGIVGVQYANEHKTDNQLTLCIKGYRKHHFEPSNTYILRKRLVDFGIKKLVSTLLAIDSEPNHIFLRVLRSPQEVCREPPLLRDELIAEDGKVTRMYNELYSLRTDSGSQFHKLKFKPSQKGAFVSLLSRKVSLVWGPPGTGKTHTIALSVLRYIELISRLSVQDKAAQRDNWYCTVLMTAFTNAAIEEFLSKFRVLLAEANSFDGMSHGEWRSQINIEHLNNESTKRKFPADKKKQPLLVAGTVWKIYKFLEKNPDMSYGVLLIDEGSQFPVTHAGIAFKHLRTDGRVLITGDHMQLPPVLKGTYPMLSPTEPALFGSILHCLMRDDHNRPIDMTGNSMGQRAAEGIVVLRENTRSYTSICRFTQTLYPEAFEVQALHSRARLCPPSQATTYQMLPNEDMRNFMQLVLSDDQTKRLVTVNIPGPIKSETAAVEVHVANEARIVCQIIKAIRYCLDSMSIFVVTPHRAQRSRINFELAASGFASERIRVDTVERLQGDEADVVIMCYGFTHLQQLSSELDFVFNLPRFNVAVTRAKQLCILVVSNTVLYPPLSILTSARMAAFSHIKRFVDAGEAIFQWGMERTERPQQASLSEQDVHPPLQN